MGLRVNESVEVYGSLEKCFWYEFGVFYALLP
jgi:hypothetical protein